MKKCNTSSIVLSQDFFGYLGYLYFHTNFIIIYSSFVINAISILIEIALNLYNALDNIVILTMLSSV